MTVLSNNWHHLTDVQWLAMALILAGSCVLVMWLEWLSKPRLNKWSDWKRRR